MAEDKKQLKIEFVASENVSEAISRIVATLGDSQLGRAITSAGAGLAGLKAGFDIVTGAISTAIHGFESLIKAGLKADQADRNLVQSLAFVGEYSNKAFQSISEFANEIERTTGVSDEQVKSLISLGLNLGMTAEQATKAAEAAINFGAATGQSAEFVLRQLNVTLSGTAGRLGNQVGIIGNLTKAQLVNGEAIEILRNKYANFAAQSAKGLEGSLHHVSVAFGNIIEEISKFITQNELVSEIVHAVGKALQFVADSIASFRNFLNENSNEIKQWLNALASAGAIIGGLIVAFNALTIAQNLAAVAMRGLLLVMNINPFMLMITLVGGALVAAFKYFNVTIEDVIGVLKVMVGYAIMPLTQAIGFLLGSIGTAAQALGLKFGESLVKASESLKSLSNNLIESGKQQLEASQAAKKHKEEIDSLNYATKGFETQLDKQSQMLAKLEQDFTRNSNAAKNAIDAIKDFAPQLSLNEWKQNYDVFLKNLNDLKNNAITIKATIEQQGGAKNAAQEALLKQAIEAETQAQIAIQAIKIKNFQQERQAKLKEVDIALAYELARNIQVADEIYLKRVAYEQSLRQKQLEIATQRIIDEQGIQRNGIDVMTEAKLKAQEVALNSEKQALEASLNLAVSMELRKQAQLIQIRNSALSGLGGAAGASLQADQEIINAQNRNEILKTLREQNLISEQQYLNLSMQNAMQLEQAKTNALVAIHTQRAELLGLTDAALNDRIAKEQLEYSRRLESLRIAKENELITEQEYQQAFLQAEYEYQSNLNEIQMQFYNQRADLAMKQYDTWNEMLAKIQSAQVQHGAIMGAIIGAQNSVIMQTTQNALQETATMMQTGNQTQFEIGKAAAIANATIATLSASAKAFEALAGIPIVGPALATAASAAIFTAGMLKVQQIRATNYRKGGQADEGLTEVPHYLSGRSFILEGGERVIKTEQNKDLTLALEKINSGQITNAPTINITINGNADKSAVGSIKDAVIEALREASERGRPIISSRGVV
jgi:hypothetical protein